MSSANVAVSIVEDDHGEAQTLPAVEIVPDGGVYSYEARYTAGAWLHPERLGQLLRVHHLELG